MPLIKPLLDAREFIGRYRANRHMRHQPETLRHEREQAQCCEYLWTAVTLALEKFTHRQDRLFYHVRASIGEFLDEQPTRRLGCLQRSIESTNRFAAVAQPASRHSHRITWPPLRLALRNLPGVFFRSIVPVVVRSE